MSPKRPPSKPPPRPGQEPPGVSGGRRFNPFLILGIVLFVVAALYVLLIVVTIADDIFLPGNEIKIGIKLPGVDSGENPEVADINQRINILFLGLDRQRGVPEHTAARTDSVFVLTIDPFSKTAGVFSIPRDLVVKIPDGSGDYIDGRVNAAWAYGEFIYDDYDGGGPGLIKDTIEHNFGIPIDNYVILNFQDFIDLVDEVGGIDIDVPEYEADFSYADCIGCPRYAVEFFPGREHMDGSRALAYASVRESSDDFKRIERQQLVIQATAEKAVSLELFLNPARAVNLYRKFKDAVETDVSDLRIPGLAKLMQQVNTNEIRMVSIASATYPCGSPCIEAVLLAAPARLAEIVPQSMLLADWDKVEELKQQVLGDGKIQAEEALVELQNGTNDPGWAEQFAGFLRRQGIPSDLLIVGDADSVRSRSLIVDRAGKEYTAKKLAEWLNLPTDRIVAAPDTEASAFADATGDIVVVLGSDARLSTAALPSGE